MPVIIASKRHNFYRCGIPHPKQATEHPDGRFSREELEILKAEPMLTVVVTEAEVDAAPEMVAQESVDPEQPMKRGRKNK